MVFVEFQGWINTTVMFYAGYPASMLISEAGVKYNLPLAYLLVGCSYFVCSLFMVVRRSVSLRFSLLYVYATKSYCVNRPQDTTNQRPCLATFQTPNFFHCFRAYYSQSINVFASYVLCSSRILKAKTQRQTTLTEKLIEKWQNWNQNSRLSKVNLIGLWIQ